MSKNRSGRAASSSALRYRNDGWPNDYALSAQEAELRERQVDEFVREFIRAGAR